MSETIPSPNFEQYTTLAKGNEAFLVKIYSKIIKQLSQSLPLIQQHVEERDLPQLREVSHYIKPVLTDLGLDVVNAKINEIKVIFADDDFEHPEVVTSNLHFVEECLENTIEVVREELEEII